MSSIPIALQLYSIREDCKNDFAGSLEKVAGFGYDGVEFAGYHDLEAADLKKLLDGLNLKAAGTHIGIPTLLGDELEKTIEFNKTIGNKFLIVPGLPEEYRNSAEAWKKTCGIFDEIAEKAAAADMRVGYHNHTHEFTELDGEKPIDIFLANTKDNVIMQFDNGNALHGGADVNPLIAANPSRPVTVHLKEFSASKETYLPGEGDIDWKTFFSACEASQVTEWYIIEQENYSMPPMECVDTALQSIKAMLA